MFMRESRKLAFEIGDFFKGYLEIEDVRIERGLKINRNFYSPRLDVSVGPFAYGKTKYFEEYDLIVQDVSDLVARCFSVFEANVDQHGTFETAYTLSKFYGPRAFNRNARCSFGIEIERSGTRKHHVGDIFNASSLSRVAIIVTWNDAVLSKFFKTLNYLSLLESLSKPTFRCGNVIVVTRQQFASVMSGCS